MAGAASSASALRAAAFALLMPASVYLRDRGGDGDADGGGLTVRGVVAQEGIKFIVLVCRRACGVLEGPGPGIGDALACGAQICPRLVFLGRGVLYGGLYRAFKAALSAGGRTGKVSGSVSGFAAERMRRSSASSSRRSRRWASAARRRLNSSQPSGAAAHIGHDVAHFQRIRLDPAYERKVPDLQAVLSLAAHGAGEHDHWRQPENGGRPLRR